MLRQLRRFNRLFFLAVWATLLFLIATNIQAGWLYVVISFMMLLGAYSLIMPSRALKPISARMVLPELCEREKPQRATVVLENRGRLSRLMIRAGLSHSDSLEFEPPGLFVSLLPARGAVTMSAAFTPRKRGRIAAGDITLSSGGSLGLFTAERRRKIDAETLVHPAVSVAEGEAIAGAGGAEGASLNEKRFAYEDPYHYKLREYNPGDSLRSIHWKLTAKQGEPIIRLHERVIFGHAGIYVDNRRSSYPPGAEERFERLLERAISLAYYLVFVRATSVTLSAAAAPELAVDSPDTWESALRWFALIQLVETADTFENVRRGHDFSVFEFSPVEETAR